MMIGDNYEKRVCACCGKVKAEPEEWWMFVSMNCQQCDAELYEAKRAERQRATGGVDQEPF